MRYFKTKTEYEPSITGCNNGVYSVEIKEKKSFKTEKGKKYFNDFFKNNNKDITRIYEGSYEHLDNGGVSEITYFPIGKRIKEIDVLMYCPNEFGMQFMISKRTWDILESFRLPTYNKIPVKIDTFATEYFLIGFPMIQNTEIDLSKSIFYDREKDKNIMFNSFTEYKKVNFNRYPIEIHLKKRYDYDIINTQGEGLYFSENLIKKITENKIIGFSIQKSSLMI